MEIIKLNLIPSGVNPTCHAKQYDKGRTIRFELFNGLTPYTLQSGDTVTLNLRKPDNTIIESSVTATQGNKYVDLVTTEQMCAVAGYNLGTFKIVNGETDIGTLNFIMAVERDVLADGIASQSVIEDLDALVSEAVAADLGDNYYDKTEVDNLLDGKADASTTYTKTQVDNALSTKANTSDVNNALSSKADKATVDNIKIGVGFNKDLISKFVSNNFILGKAWTQGAMLNINKWSEMTINSATNRVNMIITLDVDVSAIHIEVAQGYKYQFAFFDSSNVSQAHQSSWQTAANEVYSANLFHTLRIMVAKTDDSDLSDASDVVNIYDNSVGTLSGAMSTKYGLLLANNNDGYTLKVDTTAKTIKVNASYLLDNKFQRVTISTATISYDIGNATASKALVYDLSDRTFKVVYCLDGNVSPKFDAEKHLVIAYFMANTILSNGIINTLCSYNIDNKYYGNLPRKTTSGSDQSINAKIKVCSYNLGMYTMGYSSTPITEEMQPDIIDHARKFFSNYDCDILGLQENRSMLYDITTKAAIYDYLYPYYEDVANWTCLKTRREFISSGHGTFTAESRDYTYGTISLNGIDIFLMSVHFSLTPEHRATDWSELLAILAQHEYFIVCGDFNAGNGGGTAQDEFNNAINAGYHVANGGYLGLMQTLGGSVKYYDNIITSANIIICNSFVPDVFSSMDSDHLPVIAELEIT